MNSIFTRAAAVGARSSESTIGPKAETPTGRDHQRSFYQLASCVAQVTEAYGLLIVYDILATVAYRRVNAYTRSRQVAGNQRAGAIEKVCWAVNEASIWYVKRAYCLQRSSVTTWMLRRRGVEAQLVIGYRSVPLDSHAWVEVRGNVVNDRPQYKTHFRVIDRM